MLIHGQIRACALSHAFRHNKTLKSVRRVHASKWYCLTLSKEPLCDFTILTHSCLQQALLDKQVPHQRALAHVQQFQFGDKYHRVDQSLTVIALFIGFNA